MDAKLRQLKAVQNKLLKEKVEYYRNFCDSTCASYISSIELKQQKCNVRSKKIRDEGNELHKNLNYERAVEKYNEAICLAENGSECLGIAYANRSAAYFFMQQYEECLKSIQLARKSNYPERLMPKLLERERKGLAVLNLYVEEKIPKRADFKLCYPPNENIPFLAGCVEVKTSKMGKGLYATKDIKIGDVIEIEEPFVRTLNFDQYYKRCTYCLDEKHKNLIPCDFCTKVMFCSEECKKKAWTEFHEIECEMIDGMIKNGESKIFMISKIIWTALEAFETIDEWMKFFECDKEKIQNMEIDFKNYTAKNKYESMLALVPTHKCSDNEVKNLVFAALRMQKLILRNKMVQNRFKNEREKDFLFYAIYHHYYMIKIYTSTISASPKVEWSMYSYHNCQFKQKIGCGVMAIFNLLNHSCAPNVVRVVERRKLILFAIRPIKTGQQLFCTYGPDCGSVSIELRKAHLKSHFYFDCQCEACTKGYMTENQVKALYELKNNYYQFMAETNRIWKPKTLDEWKQEFKYLEENDDNYDNFISYSIRNAFFVQMEFDAKEYE